MIQIIGIFILALITYSIIKSFRRKLCKPNFSNKTIWITGASSGIGQYLAYQFSRHNASLIISARNQKQLQRVKQKCANKDKVKVVKLDMTDYEAIKSVSQSVIKGLQEKGQKLDIVVENAGVSMRAQFKDYDFNNHLSMFDVNVNGPVCHLQQVLTHMIKNKSGQIVGITSVQGKIAPPFRTSYSGSKHAFVGILDSIRSQLQPFGIKVTNILPGYVRTNLSKNAFSASAGQKHGQQSQKGLDPEVFCRQAVKVIYMGQNEAQISHSIDVPVAIFLRNLCPDLVFFGLRLKAKQKVNNKKKQT